MTPKPDQVKARRVFYQLGCLVDGWPHFYTSLGEFRTAHAAAERCQERRACIFKQMDLGYGFTAPVVVAMTVGKEGEQ